MKNKTCIILVGPTAVGKTSVAVQLAQHFNTQIISADSRQCFKELNIGVAKPTEQQLQNVKHFFINSHSIKEEVNAKIFEDYALQNINEIFKDNDVAIVVGGTGLYVKALSEGLDEMPVIDAEIKKEIISNYNNGGMEWLLEQVKKTDPNFFSKGEIKNPQRMMRALEVKLSTGTSIGELQLRKKKERDFRIIKLGLNLPKDLLHQNINNRVDKMMLDRLLNEVKSLSAYKNLKALQTVGYKELFDHIDGKITLQKAVDKIKINTRHYAKRQMTWFKKDAEVKWFSPTELIMQDMSRLISNQLK